MASQSLSFAFYGVDKSVASTLNKLRGEFDKTWARANTMGEKMSAAGGVAANVGKKMTVGLTLPLVGIAAGAVKTSAEFGRNMNLLAAQTGAPSKQMDQLSKLALQMGKDTVFSANDASAAMLELAKGGLTPAQIAAGGLKGTMTLAAAGNLQLADAAHYATNAMNMFNLKAKDVPSIADALAGAANASTASVESLGLGLAQVGPGARNAGLSLNDTVGVLAAFDQAGIKGADAGTSLKTMLQRLVPSTKASQDAMAALGLTFQDAHGAFLPVTTIAQELQDKLKALTPVQRSQALQTIFGSDATRAATVLMNDGAKGISGYIDATKKQGSAQKLANANMKGTAGALENMKGSIETAQKALGDALAPAVQKTAGFLKHLADVFAGMPKSVQTTIATVGIFVAVAGPIALIAGKAAQNVRLLAGAYTLLTTASLRAALASKAETVALATMIGWDKTAAAAAKALGLATAASFTAATLGAAALVGGLVWLGTTWFNASGNARKFAKSIAESVPITSVNNVRDYASRVEVLTKKQNDLKAVMDKGAWDNGILNQHKYNEELKKVVAETDKAKQHQIDLNSGIASYSNILGVSRNALIAFGDKNKIDWSHPTQVQIAAAKKYFTTLGPGTAAAAHAAAATKVLNTAIAAQAKDISGTVSAWDAYKSKADVTTKSVLHAMLTRMRLFGQEAKNVAVLASRGFSQTFIKEAEKQGPEYVAAVARATPMQTAALKRAWGGSAKAAVDVARATVTAGGTALPGQYAAGVTKGKSKVAAATRGIVITAMDELNMGPGGAGVRGQRTAASMAAGITAKKPVVKAAGVATVKTVMDTLAYGPGQAGHLGLLTGQSHSNGIRAKLPVVKATGLAVVKTVRDELDLGPGQANTRGQRTGQALRDGITAKLPIIKTSGHKTGDALAQGFSDANSGKRMGDNTKSGFDKVKDAMKGSFRWVVGQMIGGGLLSAVNHLASLVHIPQLHIGMPRALMATGGHVRGPGGPREDRIPALLSNGEFVVNARSTAMNRGLLEKINAGVQHFKGGGHAVGGTADSGVWRRMWAAVHGQFPAAQLISSFRPGARVHGSGNVSMHASGHAIDVTPSAAIFNWIAGKWGKSIHELIYSPMNGNQIYKGQHHMFGEPTRSDHFSHVHWGMDSLGGAGGGLFGLIADTVKSLWSKAKGAFTGLLDRFGGLSGGMGAITKGAAKYPLNAIGSYFGSKANAIDAQNMSAGAGLGGGTFSGLQAQGGSNRAIGRSLLSQTPWASQWNALNTLWTHESNWNNRAQNPVSTAYGIPQFLNCVTMDTECLTRDGWKTWDQVQVGDETLGYNPETDRSEWTPILAKVVKKSEPVVRMSVGNWAAKVTPGHRWWSERVTSVPVTEMTECPHCGAAGGKRGPFVSTRAVQSHCAKEHGKLRALQPTHRVGEFVRTDSITKAHRLRVSAPADDGNGNDQISVDEAALLGWIVGDGHINHASRTVNVWVFQAKPRYIPVIDALLADTPHSRYTRDRGNPKHQVAVEWRLSSVYARDLLARSGLLDGTPDEFILSLSEKQRHAWLEAVYQAEGWPTPSGDAEIRQISQNVGPWADAMTLAVFLDGYRPTRRLVKQREEHHSENWTITFGRPLVGGTAIEYENLGEQDVWCVQTGLGTWTMRQDGLPMVTGNSTWAGTGYRKTSDPRTQILAGLEYIGSRYGSPNNAWNYWSQHHSYNKGGIAGYKAGTPYVPRTGPAILHQGEAVIPAKHNKGSSRGGDIYLTVDLRDSVGHDETAIASKVTHALETAKRRGARSVVMGW